MVHLAYSKLFSCSHIITKCKFGSRKISKYIHKDISSKIIRHKFLNFFVNENGHKFVKSSPVVPFCDPTVAFVNAGMNQFKGVFLGTHSPPHTKVANSQKCIRVGGKHNDLCAVGADGYHHTFFEMLGNWSFGDYFKTEACQMAWYLLTNIYKIPAARIYVTYFDGDEKLGLPSDFETKEIWKQIGVKPNRILPFGVKENFWEMGLTGPCGSCTEIHVDLLGHSNRAKFVNKNLPDLTEIWNIVFIEYNRNLDGSITPLPKKHVDTGLGFERLTSVLQGKRSNYDTDIFSYLFDAIHKICSGVPKYEGKFGENDWNNLDTSYRILADHIRMITASLADGIIPEQNQKLRRILRKSFALSETVFQRESGLVKELTSYVVENLGSVYPEMERNAAQIHQIIQYEEEVYKSIKQDAEKDLNKLAQENPKLQNIDLIDVTPSFLTAYRELSKLGTSQIDSNTAFKMYDAYGLDEDAIQSLCDILNLKFDPTDLNNELEKAKLRSKQNVDSLQLSSYMSVFDKTCQKTDDSFKYSYSKNGNEYVFPDLEVKVLKVVKSKNKKDNNCCSILLDKTNLYFESGGQTSDFGTIKFDQSLFEVESVENVDGYIFHNGHFNGPIVSEGALGKLTLDREFRLSNMQNHTSTHLLNAILKSIKGATCQKSSKVTDSCLVFDVAIFGMKLSTDEVTSIEQKMLDLIRKKIPVKSTVIDSQKLYKLSNVTLIPGEIYPEKGIRIIEVSDGKGFISREPCCGTHVLNTSDIKDFCITGLKSLGRSTVSLTAVTGNKASIARENANELSEEILLLQTSLKDNMDKPEVIDMALSQVKQKCQINGDDFILPVAAKNECMRKLDEIGKHVKEISREHLKDFIEMEIQNALESYIRTTNTNKKYLVYYLRSSMILDSVPLHRATRLCPDIPVLIISYTDGMVKARCCVPEEFKNEKFDAETWVQESVSKVFKSKANPPKGQDGSLVCNMKPRKVHLQEWDILLQQSIKIAQKYIEDHL